MTSIPSSDPAGVVLTTALPSETVAVGRRLAGLLRPGDVVLLVGPLGAGKTQVAAGVADGLGIDDPVSSPSFVIVRSYVGFLPLHHADVYRLGSTAEWDDLDLLTMAADGVLLVEWGNAVAGAVPDDHLVVDIAMVGDHERSIAFIPHGGWSSRPLWELSV
ncbi:MAG: tRNA (adenosine(37)-N6)-threonylcarbamoyltransferase complex ATPase subunit type 1 TsaE [Acidimicrobiia bacterium]